MRETFSVFLLLSFCLALAGSAIAQAPASPTAGEVAALLPVARLQHGTTAPAEARLHDDVFWRDWVETEAQARARLALLDGSQINIGSGARLQVVRHEEASQQTEVELEFGKVRNRVRQLTAPDARFEVRTNTAVIGVVGTHFYVEAQAALARVINFEGRVRVRNADLAVAGEVILETGELAEIERGQPPRKRRATPQEIQQALEDTLPGLVTRLVPSVARVGSCISATTTDQFRAAEGPLARLPFMEIQPRACAAPDLTPVRICVLASAEPGIYDYALKAADGTERWGAFQVEPPAPLAEARLVYSPELPPGATHYARVVGRDNQPLSGVPVRLRREGKEETVHTDEQGGLTVQAPEKGTLELELVSETTTTATAPAQAAKPVTAAIRVVDRLPVEPQLPDFSQRGSVLNIPGEVRRAELGGLELPVARTVTRAGRAVSTVAIPPEAPEGPSTLQIEDAAGQHRRHPLQVYEVLAARLDQHLLSSGAQTQGEFLVCVGAGGEKLRRVRARIQAVGPVHFRGKGAEGKSFERTFPVEPSGLVRVPFDIQAEKGAPGAGIPFTLTLRLEKD
ncbi:MAG: FecR domain-containing protein [Acidobacteria bacterium]|nr:FecR domain-containing protein [Acidobacteriota bacterium]